MDPLDKLTARLGPGRVSGGQSWFVCPAHPDQHPSLAARPAHGGVLLLKCWAGCSTPDVLAALGWTWADLWPTDKAPVRWP